VNINDFLQEVWLALSGNNPSTHNDQSGLLIIGSEDTQEQALQLVKENLANLIEITNPRCFEVRLPENPKIRNMITTWEQCNNCGFAFNEQRVS
jgi:hypothetical protein